MFLHHQWFSTLAARWELRELIAGPTPRISSLTGLACTVVTGSCTRSLVIQCAARAETTSWEDYCMSLSLGLLEAVFACCHLQGGVFSGGAH